MAANFNLSKVGFLFAFLDMSGGFGADGAIKIEKVKPDFDFKEGLNGDGVWWASNSDLVKITINYVYGTDAAKKMIAINAADKLLPGSGIQPLAIIDTLGTMTLIAAEARITKVPDVELGAEPKDSVFEMMALADIYIPV